MIWHYKICIPFSPQSILTIYNTCTGKYEDVEVTKEVYEAYKRSYWNEENRDRSFYKHQSTLSSLIGNDNIDNFHELVEISERRYEEELLAIHDTGRAAAIRKALAGLTDSELQLIKDIYINKKTEQELAAESNVSQQAISKRKKRIIAKLSKELGDIS